MLLSLSRVNPGKRLGLRRHESGGGAGLDLLVDLHLKVKAHELAQVAMGEGVLGPGEGNGGGL